MNKDLFHLYYRDGRFIGYKEDVVFFLYRPQSKTYICNGHATSVAQNAFKDSVIGSLEYYYNCFWHDLRFSVGTDLSKNG